MFLYYYCIISWTRSVSQNNQNNADLNWASCDLCNICSPNIKNISQQKSMIWRNGNNFQKRRTWQDLGVNYIFVNVHMMLYIMYFPVYRSKGDYNNFTSAHSWPMITLRVWRFQWINLEVFLSLTFPSTDSDS